MPSGKSAARRLRPLMLVRVGGVRTVTDLRSTAASRPRRGRGARQSVVLNHGAGGRVGVISRLARELCLGHCWSCRLTSQPMCFVPDAARPGFENCGPSMNDVRCRFLPRRGRSCDPPASYRRCWHQRFPRRDGPWRHVGDATPCRRSESPRFGRCDLRTGHHDEAGRGGSSP